MLKDGNNTAGKKRAHRVRSGELVSDVCKENSGEDEDSHSDGEAMVEEERESDEGDRMRDSQNEDDDIYDMGKDNRLIDDVEEEVLEELHLSKIGKRMRSCERHGCCDLEPTSMHARGGD